MNFRRAGRILIVAACVLISVWTFGAVYYDGPFPGAGNLALAVAWLVLAGLAVRFFKGPRRRFLAWLAVFLIVLIPWLCKQPSNERRWAPEFARAPRASIEGDLVTFTNFRHFDYQPDGKPVERWETRSFHLSKLKGMDFFMTYWGGELIGHPMFGFDFGDDGHLVFSIESRREENEEYSVFGGLYKLYELVYIVGDESDIIRVRTNFRKGEDVYLYRLDVRQETVRLRFMEYLDAMNRIHSRPEFYDSVTANCITTVRRQLRTKERDTLDWRLVANGKLDELFRDHGLLVEGVPFPELKRRGHVNPAAHANPAPDGFPDRIREGVPGF